MKLKYNITTVCILLAMMPSIPVYASLNMKSIEEEIFQNKEFIEDKYEEKEVIKSEIEKTSEEMQALSSSLSVLFKETQEKAKKIQELNGAIRVQEQAVESAEKKVAITETNIDARIKDIKEKEEELIEQQTLLDARVRASYKQNPQNGIISMLLQSEGLIDFFERLKFIEIMTQKDNEAITSINEMVKSIEEEKLRLEGERRMLLEEKAELVTGQAKLMDARQSIADEKSSMEKDIDNIKVLEDEKSAAIARMNDDELKIAQEIGDIMDENDALESELQEMIREEQRKADIARKAREEAEAAEAAKKQNGSNTASPSNAPSSQGYVVPTRGRISSSYGFRIHPIWNVSRMHTGIDYAASTGTPIVATKSGTVIASRYMNSYGNTVIVDHGNGISSLYAHMSSFSVTVGTQVSQGQKLGGVGSTGDSTGPHLHFEIRVNGTHTNPANYVN